MANLEITKYALRDLYNHELLMRDSYAEQLKQMQPGKARDLIQRIHSDEIKHCDIFEGLMRKADPSWVPLAPVKPRSWNFENGSKEAITWDQQMEEKLECVYMEQLSSADLTEEVKQAIDEVMRETHAHSELLKVLLSEM